LEPGYLLDFQIDEILEDARLGDPQATAALCMHFYPKVLKYMRYRVDAASAEDLTNEVFLRVLRHLPSQKGSFVAWIYRIAGNAVVDHFRAMAARREEALDGDILMGTGHGEIPSEASDRRMDLKAAISTLTDDQRELVTLKFIQGLSNAEIAEVTGRSPEALRALQFRALMALRRAFGKRTEGDDNDK
jgi:RNA polymerase sigma-70 factor (ECF subfamily)